MLVIPVKILPVDKDLLFSESIVSEHVDWFYAQKEIFEKQGCTLNEMNSK